MSSKFSATKSGFADAAIAQNRAVTPQSDDERVATATLPNDRNVVGIMENSADETVAAGSVVNFTAGGFGRADISETVEAYDFLTVTTGGAYKVCDTADMVHARAYPDRRTGATDMSDTATGALLEVMVNPFPFPLNEIRVGKVTFDPSANTAERTIAAHALAGAIPDNSLIIHSYFNIITTFTSAGADAGSIAFAGSAGGAVFCTAATIVANAAQVITLTPPAINTLHLTCSVSADFDGSGVQETLVASFITDGSGSAAEAVTALAADINANIDQLGAADNTIIATGTGTLILTAEGTFLGTRPFKAVGGGGGTWSQAATVAFTYGNRWDADSGPGNDGRIPGPHDISRPSTWQETTAAGVVTATVAVQALTAGKCELVYFYVPTA